MTQKEKNYKFSYTVKQRVLKLAGGRCAFEGCAKHLTSDKNNYEIAHIYPASNEGPRSKFIKEHDIEGGFRESEENGILMCPDHASFIDKDNGEGYPPEILLGWKKVIELANDLIAHNPQIQRYEQQVSVPEIISVVRKKYDASKKNHAIDINKAIEEKLNHLYNERIANEHKISELECKLKVLSSEVKQLINEKKEAHRINNENNQQATHTLFEIIKSLPGVQANFEVTSKDKIENKLFYISKPSLNLTVSLNGQSFKFSGIEYDAWFTINSLKKFVINPRLPFLRMCLIIKNSKLEKIDCEITTQIGPYCNDKYKENLKKFCDIFESLQHFKKPITADMTLEFKRSSATTTFKTSIHSGIKAPNQFLKVAKEILHCIEAEYQGTFQTEIYDRLLLGTLLPEESRQIRNSLYKETIKNKDALLEFKNYNCAIKKSSFGKGCPKGLKIREISSKTNNASNTESAKPTLLIEI